MRTFRFFGWLIVSLLLFSRVSFAAETDVDRLLNLLVEKGVVTSEDAAGFRADLAVTKQEEKEGQKEFTVVAGKPVKISGYTQVRYQFLEEKDKIDSFDIRRARLDIKADVTERFDYRLQADFAGSSVKLLDATIGYKVNPYLKLTAGQFKVPFSQENLASSPKLETINRSQVVEALVARGKDVIGNQNGRDIGVQVSGGAWKRDDRALLDYAFGVFNGAGINISDNNEEKDFAGRVVFHPVKGLDIGASYYDGTANYGTPKKDQNRNRAGLELAYAYENLSLKGEYITGNDGKTDKNGWYLQAGYFFIPKKLQGVLKYDIFDPDTKKSKDETSVSTLGINWFFNKWVFLQVNSELKEETGVDVDNNVLNSQLSLWF